MKANKMIEDAMDFAYNELTELVKQNNGFIDTQSMLPKNKGCDIIYGIDFNWDDGINEMYVLAVAYTKDSEDSEGYLSVYLAPIMATWMTKIDNWEEHMDDEYDKSADGYWMPLRGSDVYYYHTLANICEVIEEYID